MWLMAAVSRRWMCVKSMGVASGCGFKDLFSSYYLSLLLLYLFFFAAASLFLVNFFPFLILAGDKNSLLIH